MLVSEDREPMQQPNMVVSHSSQPLAFEVSCITATKNYGQCKENKWVSRTILNAVVIISNTHMQRRAHNISVLILDIFLIRNWMDYNLIGIR